MFNLSSNIVIYQVLNLLYSRYNALQLSVVKSKENPIPTDENSAMNQSEYEAITCSWHQVRENPPVQVANAFGIASHWLKKWLEFS